MADWVAPSVSAIAGCVGSAVVENIVNMGISYLGNRMLSAETGEALRRVKRALPQLRAVMGVAEALKMKDPNTSEWVWQFRDALDEAEDVLDEFEYKVLEDMVKNQDEDCGSSSGSKKEKTCAISDDMLERFKKAVTKLDEVTANVGYLLQLASMLGVRGISESQQEVCKELRRETTSFLTEREVFGRDAEKDMIIDWLKCPTQAQLSSFGIVGMGGLGKTTLAQFACQEVCRSNLFQKTIWVCVSTDFSVKGITIAILTKLGERCHGDETLNILQETLHERIHSKKIILILDDVWEEQNDRS